MTTITLPARPARLLSAAALALLVSACSMADLPQPAPGNAPIANTEALPPASGQVFGKGPVRVALLLPLSGDPSLSAVGTSMANGAQLAIGFIEANESIADNITLMIKDTGPSAGGATAAANQALQEGARLILGPLRAEQVTAVGAVARSAGVPVIGFSNNSGVAAPGVYLLNVLPEVEVRRSLKFAQAQGRKAYAGVFPSTDFGRIQEGAFRQAVTDLGLGSRAVYNFASEAEARAVVAQLVPLLQAGQIDALFLPDRSTAPSFGVLLEQAGIPQGSVQIIGSADWNGDANIAQTPYLSGAIFPAVDDAGYQALLPEYQAKFGGSPHALVTIGYTATVLANASSLSMSTPKYDRGKLTVPGGFQGRDGVFRFLKDGRSEYALVIKQVRVGGASIVDGPKL